MQCWVVLCFCRGPLVGSPCSCRARLAWLKCSLPRLAWCTKPLAPHMASAHSCPPPLNARCSLPLSLAGACPAACRYGSRAVELLRRYYEGQMTNVMSEDEEEGAAAAGGRGAAGRGGSAADAGGSGQGARALGNLAITYHDMLFCYFLAPEMRCIGAGASHWPPLQPWPREPRAVVRTCMGAGWLPHMGRPFLPPHPQLASTTTTATANTHSHTHTYT